MAEKDPKKLGDILGEVGARAGLGPAARSTGKLWSRWPEVVGDQVAQHAEPTSLREGVLRVRADSPAWATEVGYLGAEIARRAAEISGAEISEVRVWTAPGPVVRRSRDRSARTPVAMEPKRSPEDAIVALQRAHEAWLERRRRESS